MTSANPPRTCPLPTKPGSTSTASALRGHTRHSPRVRAVCPHTTPRHRDRAHCAQRHHNLWPARNTVESQDIDPGQRVCILAWRSVVFVTAIPSAEERGAVCAPGRGHYPPGALKVVLKDAAPSVMDEFANDVVDVPKICLHTVICDDELSNADSSPVEDRSSATDGAYCIYTSGTTGVDVKHQDVMNVISWSPGDVCMKLGMRVGQFLSIAFDMGGWEILGSLYNGATLRIRGSSRVEWKELMKMVDVVIATPSILREHEPEDYQNIKHVIPKSGRQVGAPHTPEYPSSIGKPIPNTNVYVLSSDPGSIEAVPIGQVGYMWVGGIDVSNGYLNLPEKTAESWKKDPFVEGGGMMFNTVGRWWDYGPQGAQG